MKLTQNSFEKEIIPISIGLNQLLLKKYPSLSLTELKLCALLVLNISSKEIGELTSRSVRTIEFTRLNIRKKMSLPADENLVKHLILCTEEGKDTDTSNYHYHEKK